MKYLQSLAAIGTLFALASNAQAALIEITVEGTVSGPLPFFGPPANFPPPFVTGDSFNARWVVDDSAMLIGTNQLPPPQVGTIHDYGAAVVEFDATITSSNLGMDIDVSAPAGFSRGAQVINDAQRPDGTFDQFIVGDNSVLLDTVYLNQYLANFPGADDLFVSTIQLVFGADTSTPDFLTSSELPDILALEQLFSFSNVIFDVRNGSAANAIEFFTLPAVLYTVGGLTGTIRELSPPPSRVSEPATIALVAFGLMAIPAIRRRRN